MRELHDAVVKESGLSRVWSKSEKHVGGIITGWRGENTRAQNKENNYNMLKFLYALRHYDVTSLSGVYAEALNPEQIAAGMEPKDPEGETSFLVFNTRIEGDDGGLLAKDLYALGQGYNQDSVLIIPVGGKDAWLWWCKDIPKWDIKQGDKEVVGNAKYGDWEFSGKIPVANYSRFKGRVVVHEGEWRPERFSIQLWSPGARRVEKALIEKGLLPKPPPFRGYFGESKPGEFGDLGKGRIKCVEAEDSDEEESRDE